MTEQFRPEGGISMYERSYGYKYTEAGDDTAAGIAKRIRADIQQAVDEKLLPGKPVEYSVRSDTYPGGCSIDVTVRNWPAAWQECDGSVPGKQQVCHDAWCAANNPSEHARRHQVLTEEAQAAQMTLERIHGAYNHDGSEIQTDYFDVRYYGQVQFETAESARWRAEEKAKKEAKRAAVAAAELGEVRRVVVYGSGDKRNVHDAVEVDGRLRLVCGAQLWRGSLTGDGAGRDLTCSRCQKRAARRD